MLGAYTTTQPYPQLGELGPTTKKAIWIGGIAVGGYVLYNYLKYRTLFVVGRKGLQLAGAGVRKMRRKTKRNPYSPSAEFFHVQVEDSKKFRKGSYKTVDPAQKDNVKLKIAWPKTMKKRRMKTQQVMVRKTSVPKSAHAGLKKLEIESEKKPVGVKNIVKRLKRFGVEL